MQQNEISTMSLYHKQLMLLLADLVRSPDLPKFLSYDYLLLQYLHRFNDNQSICLVGEVPTPVYYNAQEVNSSPSYTEVNLYIQMFIYVQRVHTHTCVCNSFCSPVFPASIFVLSSVFVDFFLFNHFFFPSLILSFLLF